MAEILVNVTGETCPVPLVEVRKAIKKALPGDTITVIGTNEASKKEIPMAADALGLKVLDITENNGTWKIQIQR